MRKCKYCGKEFKAFSPKQDYCSRECYEQGEMGRSKTYKDIYNSYAKRSGKI